MCAAIARHDEDAEIGAAGIEAGDEIRDRAKTFGEAWATTAD